MTNRSSSIGTVHAPGPATFELHTLGWRSFQDLCAAVLREVWGQSVQPFADSRDGGRDGAFYGRWSNSSPGFDVPDGPFVLQCKFLAHRDKTLSLSGLDDELSKIKKLVSRGLCRSYMLMTNARVTGTSEQAIRQAVAAQGVAHPLVLGGAWVNQTIAFNRRLRMFVPRVYGLGDLSQILDERAYDQARALLNYLQEDLSTFVVTDAYRRAARAIEEHGFCLLLGEPAVGKSVIAATLAMTALDQWGSLTIRADSPADIVGHWNPHEPNQVFWIDDAFGTLRHEREKTEGWAARLPKVMAAVKGGAKVVLTSRDYIYRDARLLLKEYVYPRLREQQVVIDVADLTQPERQQILYNHIRLGDQPKDVRAELKPHLEGVADQSPFRPEVARRLGSQAFTKILPISSDSVREFMARPNKFLQDVYEGLEPDLVGALTLVYQAGELPVPLELMTPERQELLALVGSSPNGVGRALSVLEGTYLRRAPKPGSSDDQQYWSFRHPTLREGFATLIAGNPNLLKVLIQGLDDEGILTQVDCGSGVTQGTLVVIPPPLFDLVARRVAQSRVWVTWNRSWVLEDRWIGFLAFRCSPAFLKVYLDIDASLIDRCLRIGSYLSGNPELTVLARLREIGLLPEPKRLRALATIGDLAIQTPDADWLRMGVMNLLFTDQELAAILARVRLELIPNLEDTLIDWSSNEQGDSAEQYYEPLEEALKAYAEALRDDAGAQEALEQALSDVDYLRSEASYWRDDDTEDMHSNAGQPSAYDFTWQKPVANPDPGSRSVFDDVDG